MREVIGIKSENGDLIELTPYNTITSENAFVYTGEYTAQGVRVWESGTGHIDATSNGFISVVRMTPPGGDGLQSFNTSNPVSVWYVETPNENPQQHMVRILFFGTPVTDAENLIRNNSWSNDALFYQDTYDNAIENGYLETYTVEEWDDTPIADGDTTEDNFGGETADLMPYDDTDNQGVSYQDLLIELGWDGQTGLNPYDSLGNCGFFTPYVLSDGLLSNLGYCMFSSSMWNTISQWFSGIENPLSGFLRVLDFPCSLPAGTTAHHIAICGQDIYYEASPGSERLYATGYHLTSRYRNEVLGTISLKEVWGTARDYTDTNISIYLPFVGMRDLDSQLCVGRNLTLLLRIDCWTGDVVYILHVDNDSIGGKWFRSAGYVYRWMGNCASEIPLGRIDNDKGLTTLLGGLGGMAYGIASGNPLAIAGGTASALGSLLSGGIRKSVQTSGTLTGNTGALDVMYPYLVVQRAVPNYPNGWRNFIGAPKSQRYKCSDLTGFTVFESIHLDDLEGASEEEINELERVLTTEGIIF